MVVVLCDGNLKQLFQHKLGEKHVKNNKRNTQKHYN